MTKLDLSDEVLAELRRRHVEFLMARLTSAAAHSDLERLLGQGWARLLDLRIREIVDADRLAIDLARALSDHSVRELFAPLARDVGRRVLAALRDDAAAVGESVPAEARRAIEELARKPDLVPERLLREVLRQQAVEVALRDVLFDTLKRFHDTVNPFFADWGIPALLGWLPIGASAVRASMGTLRAEFDKRLEPEMRKFLGVFSREATARLADELLARSNDPNLIALRHNVIVFLYEQPVRELLAGIDDASVGSIEAAAESIALRALEAPRVRDSLRTGLSRFVGEHGDESVGEWLGAIGAGTQPDFRPWVELSWPLLRDALGSPPLRELVERITEEFYAGLRP